MDNEKSLENITSSLSSSLSTPYILNGEFYEILSQEGECVTVRCRKCPGHNIYKGSLKSTGNFHMHIKRKHSELLPRVHEMKLKSFTDRKVKMPQRRQQSYNNNNNNRKVIKINGKYHGKITSTNQRSQKNYKQNNIQMEPLDCRKNPTILNNQMIFTQIHNPINNYIPNLSYPIIKNGQSNQKDFLITSSEPPPAHQNSLDYIKKENSFIQDDTFKDEKIQISEIRNNQHVDIRNNDEIHNHNQNSLTIQNVQQRPLHIPSPPIPLIATPGSIPGHDVLLRVESHLKGIEREMRIRNQIESNRIYLELAKFKFLHPNFALQN